MNVKPLISIVIPTLNEEKYLPNMLTSILRQQNAPSFEIIVADYNRTDKTVEIAKRFVNKVAQNCEKSSAHARQAGSKLAEGELIAFIDADVILPPKFLATIPKNFKDPNVVVRRSAFEQIGGFKKFVAFHVKNTVRFLRGKETSQEYETVTSEN